MAWRNLWRQKRRTILTLASIAFGILLAVMFTAMQDYNFADMIDTAARMGSGHVTLQHPDYIDTPKLTLTVGGTDRLRELALADDEVERVVERIIGETMVSTPRDNFGAFFVAYDPAVEDESTLVFAEGLVEGRLFETAADRGVVLGKTLARNLGLELGDRVVYQLIDRNGDRTGGRGPLLGIVETNTPSVDAALCLLPIDTVRAVLGYGPDESTLVAVFLRDARESEAVAERLGEVVGPGVAVHTWNEIMPELSGFIAIKVGGARFMEIVIMLLVAAGIFNTLFVSVMERTREFGIMMAIGHTPGQIFALVMWESLFLAAVGLAAGAAVTIFPYVRLAQTGIDVSSLFGEGTEVAGVGFEPIINVGIFPENVLLIAVAVLVATLLSGLYPAWRAARVQPVDSIKLV